MKNVKKLLTIILAVAGLSLCVGDMFAMHTPPRSPRLEEGKRRCPGAPGPQMTLHGAVRSNLLDAVRTCIARGDNVNALNGTGHSPLYYALGLHTAGQSSVSELLGVDEEADEEEDMVGVDIEEDGETVMDAEIADQCAIIRDLVFAGAQTHWLDDVDMSRVPSALKDALELAIVLKKNRCRSVFQFVRLREMGKTRR